MREHHEDSGTSFLNHFSQETLGLRYEPDSFFRRTISRPELATNLRAARDDDEVTDIWAVSRTLRFTELSFGFDEGDPPYFSVSEEMDRDEAKPKPSLRSQLGEVMRQGRLTTLGWLSAYEATSGRVSLCESAIKICAERLSIQERHLGSVVMMHTTLLGLAHVGRDLDGKLWGDFALPQVDSHFVGASSSLVTLVQVFTHRQLLKLNDTALLHAFERLSEIQAPAYRGWKALRSMPLEDARQWFMCVRRGLGTNTPWMMKLEESLLDVAEPSSPESRRLI